MKEYATREALITEILKRAAPFLKEFDDISDAEASLQKPEVDRTPAQMLAYQLGWMDLLLAWEARESAGETVVTPATGYAWNRLGTLY